MRIRTYLAESVLLPLIRWLLREDVTLCDRYWKEELEMYRQREAL